MEGTSNALVTQSGNAPGAGRFSRRVMREAQIGIVRVATTTNLLQFFRITRSENSRIRLQSLVHQPLNHPMHPLLLEPEYWTSRLKAQDKTRPFLLITPRPDLSTAGCEIQEIRFRAFDGEWLWGLMGRCPIFSGIQPAALRVVSTSQPLTIDIGLVQEGMTQFIVQLPAGRRLEDRVLDALRLTEVAGSVQQVDAARVHFDGGKSPYLPDEARIADGLRHVGLA
ncbi:MAG: hypothetical protein ACI89E_001540 [Planctomycetota bacterium]